MTLDAAQLAPLQRLCAERGVTLFMLLLGAYSTLLSRLSGQTDILVGTPVAGRQYPNVEQLVGCFINTLVLRTDLSDNPPFLILLARVRDVALNAYTHQDYPFELLMSKLDVQRDSGRQPLFNTMLTLQEMGAATPAFGGGAALEAEHFELDYARAKFDLTVTAMLDDDRLDLAFEYSSDLFSPEAIARLAGYFGQLLGAIAAQPELPVQQLPLLRADQRDALVHGFNGAPQHWQVREDIAARISRQAQRAPDAVAVVLGELSLTYGELDNHAGRLATHLRARGVGVETPVAICLERSIEQIVAIVAVLKAGGYYVPVDPGYPEQRVAYMLGDAGVRVGIGAGPTATALVPHVRELVCLERDFAQIAACGPLAPQPLLDGQLAYVIYTSGSTGRPKGVQVSRANVLRLFDGSAAQFGFGPADVWTMFHSYCFDFSVWEMFGSLLYGGKLVLVPQEVSRAPHELLALLRQQGVTVLNQTPSSFIRLLDVSATGQQWDWTVTLRYVVFGGEGLDYASLAPWYRQPAGRHVQLVNMYGITETTVHVTYRAVAAADTEGVASRSIGRPLPDLRAYVLDAHMQPQPIGVKGELYVGGAGLARGYLGQPGYTAERFVPDPFGAAGGRLYRTGDLACWNGQGELEYAGRIDQQVKIRGHRIEPGEIEAALLQVDGVLACCVMAVAGERNQRTQLVAYYAAREPIAASDLRAAIGQRLPEYMLPGAFVHLRELPLTANGKIDRAQLVYVHGERPQLSTAYVAPRNEMQHKLLKIWQEVLTVDRIGIEDNFFDLGGESFTAYRLMLRVSEVLHVELPLAAIFQGPTVAEMAEQVAAAEAGVPSVGAVVSLQAGAPGRLPFFCVHPAGGDILGFQELAVALGPDQPVYGVQSLGQFFDEGYAGTLSDMARHYVGAIRAVQPQGPYLLGGHSLGAVVALEIAAQLEADGQAVGPLAVIDGELNITHAMFDTLPYISDTFGLGITAEELGAFDEKEMMAYVLTKTKKQFSRVLEISYELDILPRGFRTRDAEIFLNKIAANIDLVAAYAPARIGQVIHVYAATGDEGDEAPSVDLAAWGRTSARPLVVTPVPGNHVSLLKGANVKVLARHLRTMLDQAHRGVAESSAA
jgi:amino acid adenylation domain-containing protein